MEAIVTSINVFGNTCVGCEKFNREILVTFRVEGSDEFNDIFLDEAQARFLLDKLGRRLDENSDQPTIAKKS